MAVTDYSTTPGSNTAIAGISIAENCSPAGINNAIRQLMADIATGLDDGSFTGGSFQALDATLTTLAAVVTSANKLIYATGSDTFATTDFTAAARTLLAGADAATMLGILGGFAAPVLVGSWSSGYVQLGDFAISFRDCSLSSNGSFSFAFGGGKVYTDGAFAWCAGDDGVGDVSTSCTGNGLSSGTLYSHSSNPVTAKLIAFGK